MSLPIFLSDIHFLSQLDRLPVKEEYVRITVLDWRENPIQEIQGIVINGNVNLDGNSSMRRTASLTVFAEQTQNDLKNINSLFAINKKCKIEKGIRNTVPEYYNEPTNEFINYQEEYGDIVWFPLGVYVMFNPAISHQMTGVNISMQLKDKMCLLNGDLGGQIHSPVGFGIKDEIADDNGTSVKKEYALVHDIILQLVNHWGNESLQKIFISEVPPMIKRTVKWMGDTPVYLVTADADINGTTIYTDKEEAYNKAAELYQTSSISQEWKANHTSEDLVILMQPGRDIGYVYEDFTYPGQLSCNAGETVTSVLDKIIGILGNHEYFYDVEGNFIFQQKRNNLNMSYTASWAKDSETGQPVDKTSLPLPYDSWVGEYTRLSKPVYDFTDNKFFTAYNNTLNYNNIKNDFIVWGSRKIEGTNTEKIIRMHLAIDTRPRYNQNSDRTQSKDSYTFAFYLDTYGTVRAKYVLPVDKKENVVNPIPYGFYKDQIDNKYYQYTEQKTKSKQQLGEIKRYTWKEVSLDSSSYPYIKQVTPVDWREAIYYQMLKDETTGTGNNDRFYNTYFQYYAEIKEEFPKIFDLENQVFKSDYYSHPDAIDYFLDMIDSDTELGKYSISNIGKRTLVISDNNEGINCIFEPQIPDIVFVFPSLYPGQKYTTLIKLLNSYRQRYTQIPSWVYNALQIGSRANSCYEKIKDLLYQYTEMNQTISISSIPIYYLQPNTRITVNDDASGIYGDYIIQSISLPLDISSTMSINAYKALSKI